MSLRAIAKQSQITKGKYGFKPLKKSVRFIKGVFFSKEGGSKKQSLVTGYYLLFEPLATLTLENNHG